MAHFSGTKEINCQPRAVYPGKRCFKNEGEMKTFTDEATLREFVTSKPDLKKMAKGYLFFKCKGKNERSNLRTSEERKNIVSKIWVIQWAFPVFLGFLNYVGQFR